MSILWPRIDSFHATDLFNRLRLLDVRSLAGQIDMAHEQQSYASTGGARADHQVLTGVRDVIVTAALRHGYPDRRVDVVRFDRHLAPRLLEAMPMAVGEAVTNGVWNFTSLVLAPDVTSWRFDSSNKERWICADRNRHMFSRLWIQAWTMGEGTPEGMTWGLLDGLQESELNQIFERTSLGGCRPLARSIARAIMALSPHDRRRELVRDACRRLLRLVSVVDPYALGDEQLDGLVSEVIGRSVHSLATHTG